MENVKPEQRKTLDFKKFVGHDFLNDTDRNLLHYRSGPWISILPMKKLQNLFFKCLCYHCYQILLKFTISLHVMAYYGSLKQGH